MLAAGSGFGAALGTLLCLAGCTAGATLAMLGSRRWLQPWVRRRHGERLADIEARIASRRRLLAVQPAPAAGGALHRGQPGGRADAMRAWTFTWISFVGMAAGTFVYVNAGSELGHVRQLADLHSPSLLASLAALALLPWLLKPLLRRLRMAPHESGHPRTLVLFNYDWDRIGFGRWAAEFPHDHAGFDLFSFPSNARLPGFDLTRFVDRLARRLRAPAGRR
jgi:hypothetical protein